MHPCRWVVCICTIVVLSLTVSRLSGTASAQASDENNVSFVWAFEALVAEGNVTKQVPIKEDIKLKTGDQLKMFVELRKPCFVYVIHHGARGEIQRLFPYDVQQFTTDYHAQRLTDLEQLLATYTAAPSAEQPLAATNILAELRNLLKQHRASMKPGRPVPIAGNMRKGIEGVEITVPQLYIETFTIEHS